MGAPSLGRGWALDPELWLAGGSQFISLHSGFCLEESQARPETTTPIEGVEAGPL